ncbi:MAG TPA: hypothetical protein VF831_01050 [Anaerolineales bacterium]
MDQAASLKLKPVPGEKMLLRYWLIFGLVGLVLPILVYITLNLNYFEKWQVYTQAPPATAELIIGDNGLLYVRTTANKILSCSNPIPKCWISSILPNNQTGKACDQGAAAFNPLAHSPAKPLYCVSSQGSYAETSYTIFYALDDQGTIWKWEKTRSAYEIIVLPIFALIGAFAGVMIGSVAWVARRISIKRPVNQLPATEVPPIKPVWVWALAGLPFICLIVLAAFGLGRDILQTNTNPGKPLYTSAASTVNVMLTSEASVFLAPVTPNPSGPAYDFVDQCQNARWVSGRYTIISCSSSQMGLEPSIETLQVDVINGELASQKALQFTLPGDHRAMNGYYAVWQVKEGDHFRAVLRCPAFAPICNMFISLRLRLQSGELISAGDWQVSADQPEVDIDADLSDYSGKVVLIWLEIGTYQQDDTEHAVLLIAPRIENIPGR